ncbi:hypothetical protein KV557_13855 [Kitasatospora aureofaciens]|uniref:DUF6215 domain-containing protein n=1 Tax=Kitasatospora aureofaciens TaxID=1894 RepID=UPI001C46464E|nr:DUF6215 domain-containing protein [Kitasatospora aureofaciens]MBV6698211.1 hypothetical protein [Kitasatospora aureofaciens]
MTDEHGHDVPTEPAKGGAKSAAGQVAAALVLALAVVAAVLFVGGLDDTAAQNNKPAVCNPPKATDAPEYPALCAALNRPDLPVLVGVPSEHVVNAYSSGGQVTSAAGTKETEASAQVQLGSVYLQVSDNRDLSVQSFDDFLRPRPVPGSLLGHPSVTYLDRTTSIVFKGATASSGTGGIARHLVVAKGAKAEGGSYEIAVWRQDDATPDDAILLRVAEAVLPALPGWVPAA